MSFLELVRDLLDSLGHDSSLRVANVNFFELVELPYGLSHLHEVLAAARKFVKTDKERLVLEFPLTIDFVLLVVEIGKFKGSAAIKSAL